MSELIEHTGPVVKVIVVSLPMMNGFYDLVTLAKGLDYRRTDLLGAINIEAVMDGSEALEITVSDTVDTSKPFEGRGAYVHGPFTVKLDELTGVFKVNALKRAPSLILRVAVKSWR